MNMQTMNLVSSTGITGNVGSCKTEITTAEAGRSSLWYIETKTFATNSCTGQVDTFQSWEITQTAGLALLGGIICAIILVTALANGLYKKLTGY